MPPALRGEILSELRQVSFSAEMFGNAADGAVIGAGPHAGEAVASRAQLEGLLNNWIAASAAVLRRPAPARVARP